MIENNEALASPDDDGDAHYGVPEESQDYLKKDVSKFIIKQMNDQYIVSPVGNAGDEVVEGVGVVVDGSNVAADAIQQYLEKK